VKLLGLGVGGGKRACEWLAGCVGADGVVVLCGRLDSLRLAAALTWCASRWIFGSVTEDILTGLRGSCTRVESRVYCMPRRVAFKGSAPINLSDRLPPVKPLLHALCPSCPPMLITGACVLPVLPPAGLPGS